MLSSRHPLRLIPSQIIIYDCFYSIHTNKKKTYYEILNVKSTASQKEIRKAFLEKSKLLHPDTSTSASNNTHEEFVLLNEAYSVLIKPDQRKAYDATQHQKSSFQNPYRTTSYKSPYEGHTYRHRNTSAWTDYYTGNSQKQAKYNMEQNLDQSFWKKYWTFNKKHGGGGPNTASHDQSSIRENNYQSRDTYFMYAAISILVIFSFLPLMLSDSTKKDVKAINSRYHSWLVAKVKTEDEKK